MGSIISLNGGLGAGKTTFAQGFARGMGVKQHVGSPTFKLVRKYSGEKMKLFHVDCYRLSGIDDFKWAEKIYCSPRWHMFV